MHLNMTLTINQWTINRNMNIGQKQIDIEELEAISMKAVDMIYRAMSKNIKKEYENNELR